MAFTYEPLKQSEPRFREAFCNLYVTGFSISALSMLVFQLIVGVVFSAALLWAIVYFVLVLMFLMFGLDVLHIKDDIPESLQPLTVGSVAISVVTYALGLGFFAYLGPHMLIRVKRRVVSRLYVLAQRPLASVEGKPTWTPSSESGYNGIEIGDFYFGFDDDCLLDTGDRSLEALERAGDYLRVWYIPTEMRSWISPTTGTLVKYNCILVRAEKRISS